jgi:hypothetical protein
MPKQTLLEPEKARAHLFRLAGIVRNIAFHRTLSDYKGSLKQNFWIYTFNNFLDMAVLEWCKTFGARRETYHWTKLFSDPDSVRSRLLTTIALAPGDWTAYWNEMKRYRDDSVAHHALTPKNMRYPQLHVALDSTCFIYDSITAELEKLQPAHYMLPKSLKVYYDRLLPQATAQAKVAFEASRNLEDRVK